MSDYHCPACNEGLYVEPCDDWRWAFVEGCHEVYCTVCDHEFVVAVAVTYSYESLPPTDSTSEETT